MLRESGTSWLGGNKKRVLGAMLGVMASGVSVWMIVGGVELGPAFAKSTHGRWATTTTSADATKTSSSTTAPTSSTTVSTTSTTLAATTTTTVAPSGTPGGSAPCAGFQVAPGQLTQALLNGEPQGTVFCLAAGTYSLSGSITPQNNQQIVGAGEGQTVIDGGNSTATGFLGYSSGPQNVVIADLSIEHFTGATTSGEAIKNGLNWTLNNVEIAYNVIGLGVGTSSTVENSFIHDNTRYGLVDGNHSVLSHDIVQHNNTGNFCGGSCLGDAGAMKYITAGDANNIIENSQFVNNIGNGIWLDTTGGGDTVQNNVVSGNTQSGLLVECTVGISITGNTFSNDDSDGVGKSAWYGDVAVNDSQDVTIQNNTVDETGNGANAVSLTAAQRTCGNSVDSSCDGSSTGHGLCHVTISTNTFKVDAATQNGLVGSWFSGPISMNYDAWYDKSLSGASWAWQTYSLGWSQLQGSNQELNGTLSAV